MIKYGVDPEITDENNLTLLITLDIRNYYSINKEPLIQILTSPNNNNNKEYSSDKVDTYRDKYIGLRYNNIPRNLSPTKVVEYFRLIRNNLNTKGAR